MAEERLETPEAVPPPAEAIHMPEPSYLPVTLAFGLAIGLVGVIVNWVLSIIGAVIVVVAFVRWVSQARADMADLPLEHR